MPNIGCAQLVSEFGSDDEANGDEANNDKANEDITREEIDLILYNTL